MIAQSVADILGRHVRLAVEDIDHDFALLYPGIHLFDNCDLEALADAAARLRPILMTSFSFILGVAPLAVATGAGAEMRQSLGTAVLFGMLGVTCFGLLFTPAFYTFIRKLGRRQYAGGVSDVGAHSTSNEALPQTDEGVFRAVAPIAGS